MDLGSGNSSSKLQASSSLTAAVGDDRINLERNIMDKITIDYRVSEHMKRIADALEEILRLVKADQEKMEKYRKENDGDK